MAIIAASASTIFFTVIFPPRATRTLHPLRLR
jgi:hypothetical protein